MATVPITTGSIISGAFGGRIHVLIPLIATVLSYSPSRNVAEKVLLVHIKTLTRRFIRITD